MGPYSIRLDGGTVAYFRSREERDAAWAELFMQDAHRKLDKETAQRAALAAELAERAAMWGMP